MVLVIKSGAFKVMCQHIELKKNTYYYRRRIPAYARRVHLSPSTGKPQEQRYFSLETGDKMVACRKADTETRRLDVLWEALLKSGPEGASGAVALAYLEARGFKAGDAALHPNHPAVQDFVDNLVGGNGDFEEPPELTAQENLTLQILYGAPIPRTLSDAKQKHFDLGKGPTTKAAIGQFNRAWNKLLTITGDIPLDQLKRDHANRFVSDLVQSGVCGETVRKYVVQIRPVIQTAILEFELKITNAFDRVNIPNKNDGPRFERDTYTDDQLKAIQTRCMEVDDERRWVIALLSDSMCRLKEVLGLRQSDVKLNHPVPHICITVNEVRGVKTTGSKRCVPLVGAALWAVKRAMTVQGKYLFPVFLTKWDGKEFTSNSASAALGKWLRENGLANERQALHSFRHTMRDRLRNAETSKEVADEIGGWATRDVSGGYGDGHDLVILQKYMLKAVEALNGTGSSSHAESTLN